MIAHRLKSLNSKQLALLAAGLILVFLLLIGLAGGMGGEAEKRPKLGLMTSLPLYWGESDIGEIVRQDGEPMASYKRLAAQYDIRLIDAIDAKNLKSIHMLLLAQSRALSAEEFVELDAWVRRGGHLMILADPALQWESRYPLGDKRRPLFTSLLSPLFKHWGLELILPIGDDSGGETLRKIGDLFDPHGYAWYVADDERRRGGSVRDKRQGPHCGLCRRQRQCPAAGRCGYACRRILGRFWYARDIRL